MAVRSTSHAATPDFSRSAWKSVVYAQEAAERKCLAFTVACAAVTGATSLGCVASLGFAFNEPCPGESSTNPGGYSDYTGCFDWRQWYLAVFAIVGGALFFASLFYVLGSAVRLERSSAGKGMAAWSRTLSFTVVTAVSVTTLIVALVAWTHMMKPAETFQTFQDGTTKDTKEWTIDVFQVFLGGLLFSGAFPFALASAAVLRNMWRTVRVRDEHYARQSNMQHGRFGQCDGVDEGGKDEPSEDEPSSSSSSMRVPLVSSYVAEVDRPGATRAATVESSSACCTSGGGATMLSVFVLVSCFLLSSSLSPIWNFSANSYFKTPSSHSLWYLPVGDPLNGNCTYNDKPVPCYWFTWKIFPDTTLYYLFLITCVVVGAAAHHRRWKWSATKLPAPRCFALRWLGCFPNGLTVLEACAAFAVASLFVVWFVYWNFVYDRFGKVDIKHDCWPYGANNFTIAGFYDCPSDNVPTGNGNLHILSRVTGHMASLAFALTLLPVAKRSPFLHAIGVSWEQVLHWHRGLGAVAYLAVTLHMSLWWLKWALDGTLSRNLFAIDTHRWLWVTPSWNHYENWSVLMAQIGWIFFTLCIVLAWTVRRTMYRWFYVSHHVAVVFTVFGLLHAWAFWYFAAPGIILWWLDRLVTLVQSSEPAVVTSLENVSGGVTCVEVVAPDVARRFRTAQYAWINIPSVSRHEFHPFTINIKGDNKVVFLCKTMRQRPPTQDRKNGGWVGERCSATSRLTWTEKLAALAGETSDHNLTQGALFARGTQIIGPFAGVHAADLDCSPVVLFAGGIGITPVISAYESAVLRGADDVTLVWCVRDAVLLDLPVVRDVLKHTATASRGVVDVRVHVTRGGLDAVPPELLELSHVSVVEGRPALGEIVEGVVRRRTRGAEASGDARGDVNAALRLAEGAAFGFACGPARLQTELATLCKRHGFSRIHTETFEF